jgi:hypothetical protein
LPVCPLHHPSLHTNKIAVMITDLEYPYRPAFSLLTKILDEHQPLLSQLPPPNSAASAAANAFGGSNPSTAAAGGLPPAQKGKLEGTLAQYLTKYQDPKQADTIMKVQKELDETKIVLVSWPIFYLAGTDDIAQDDRVCFGEGREIGQPSREIERTIGTIKDVLQDRQEGKLLQALPWDKLTSSKTLVVSSCR